MLGSQDKQVPENRPVAPHMQGHLKLLASVSAMLVMNHEVIAIMPKRCATGFTLFIGLEPILDSDTEDLDEVEDANTDIPQMSLHLITKNPQNTEIGSVALTKIPEVDLGDDIFQFIVKNWAPSFEIHAQTIARLIGVCYSGGKQEWLRLAHYSLFQSSSKVARRIRTNLFFNLLTTLTANDASYPITADFPGLTKLDQMHVRGLFVDDNSLAQHLPLLAEFVRGETVRIPTDLVSFIQEFRRFFNILLREFKWNMDALELLRKACTPPSVASLEVGVNRALGVAMNLHHFVWSSEFFRWYILGYEGPSIAQRYAELMNLPASAPDPGRDLAPSEPMASHQPSIAEESGDEGDGDPVANCQQNTTQHCDHEGDEADMDFPTELETVENLLLSVHHQHSPPHKTYSWLRLITSTFHHTLRFKRNTPGTQMRLNFQLIKYPMSDRMMKPWQETIAELAGDKGIETAMVDALRKKGAKDWRFAPFLLSDSTLEFKGRAHCEAVLACLHSLAKRDQKTDWAGIPQDLMDLLKTTYSIVAPSKRCCPVCATLIEYLSRERGAPMLQTLTRHRYIFPTALPFGLPEAIRRHLINEYKQQLTTALEGIVNLARASSCLSLQSETLSIGSGDEDDLASEVDDLEDDYTQRWLRSWLPLSEPDRREMWETLEANKPMEWERYRNELCCQSGMWKGYIVPEYVNVAGAAD